MKSKVLLIDDSVTIHRVIDLSIDVDRYDIVKVFSKEDAALKMQSEQYDYILLDNKLDNIIIAEYIKELKAAQPSAAIILLVGAFDRFDESDLEKTGADDYLVKPFDSQSLNEKLSSDADMMPAGIVEKIAEADFARDNDDYITPTAALITGEVIDGLSKKEYLENLEEVQPDDLTDHGYAEDLDTTTSLEFDRLPKESEETFQADNIIEEHSVEENIIDESPEEDIIVTEDNIPAEPLEYTEDNTADKSLENNAVPFNKPVEENIDILEDNTETISAENNEDITAEENMADDMSVISDANSEALEEEQPQEEAEYLAENNIEENIPDNVEGIEIPDNITAVHNPVLPDIDDAADISDEYVMHDNLAEVDNQSQSEMLDEFPDFPEVDDISTDEMQDNQDIAADMQQDDESAALPNMEDLQQELPVDNFMEENTIEETDFPQEEQAVFQEEAPAEQEQETLFIDDDNWLSDAPTMQEEPVAEEYTEEQQLNFAEENPVQEQSLFEETLVQEENEPVEETGLFEEQEEEVETFDIPAEEQEYVAEYAFIATEETNENDYTVNELSEMPSLEETASMANAFDNLADENTAKDIMQEESAEAYTAEMPVEESSDIPENTAVNESPVLEEAVLPVQKAEISQEPVNIQQTEVKQAEQYSPETSGRFGGITVTISRDEIIAMLGNAIDKHFLEEAVKEVIAANMKDIVRNIVPAIAEKYIKEEIERLKNDE